MFEVRSPEVTSPAMKRLLQAVEAECNSKYVTQARQYLSH